MSFTNMRGSTFEYDGAGLSDMMSLYGKNAEKLCSKCEDFVSGVIDFVSEGVDKRKAASL